MATRHFTRSFHTTKQFLSSSLPSCSRTSLSLSNRPFFPSSLFHLRPPIGAISASFRQLSPSATAIRCCSTCRTPLHLEDSRPKHSNRPPPESFLLGDYDFKHWLVVMDQPEEDDTSRDKIIDSYIKTLAMVVGSEEEARMKIYSVSTRHYYAFGSLETCTAGPQACWSFGALVSEELSYKIKDLPRVRHVLPYSYLDAKKKDYGGEPFINGRVVPYDPKYHKEWVRNANRRNNRNMRNLERNEIVQKQDSQTPTVNLSTQNPEHSMAEVPPSNAEGALDMQMPSSKTGSWSNMGGMQANSSEATPNVGGIQSDNMGGAPNIGGMQANSTEVAPNVGGIQSYNMGGTPKMGGMQANSMEAAPNVGGIQSDNMGETPKMGGMQTNRMEAAPNVRGLQSDDMGGAPDMGGMQANSTEAAPNVGGIQSDNIGGAPNMGAMPPNNTGVVPPNNTGGVPNNTPYSQYWNGHNSEACIAIWLECKQIIW
ncbi:multiple organellar RNA editing factor 8, chloroplastic/mitochondrial-like [Cornus florida]|uniref:multiple organellar RNA editing factor 8, chloroplastic/mitochondrial-like n=1 Tax=Cornus florida TaxID=4283 RepID=UPI00289F5757|nr:multiple organellar RNA editing factor 8, chloroplastic/mitochondrial-like [Cornus florida]